MDSPSTQKPTTSLLLMWGSAVLLIILVRFLPAAGGQIPFVLPLVGFIAGVFLYAKYKKSTSSIPKTIISTLLIGGGILFLTSIAYTIVALSAV